MTKNCHIKRFGLSNETNKIVITNTTNDFLTATITRNDCGSCKACLLDIPGYKNGLCQSSYNKDQCGTNVWCGPTPPPTPAPTPPPPCNKITNEKDCCARSCATCPQTTSLFASDCSGGSCPSPAPPGPTPPTPAPNPGEISYCMWDGNKCNDFPSNKCTKPTLPDVIINGYYNGCHVDDFVTKIPQIIKDGVNIITCGFFLYNTDTNKFGISDITYDTVKKVSAAFRTNNRYCLISLGGAAGAAFGGSKPLDVNLFMNALNSTFSVNGKLIIDGIDFDFEANVNYSQTVKFDEFIKNIKEQTDLFLSTAPQLANISTQPQWDFYKKDAGNYIDYTNLQIYDGAMGTFKLHCEGPCSVSKNLTNALNDQIKAGYNNMIYDKNKKSKLVAAFPLGTPGGWYAGVPNFSNWGKLCSEKDSQIESWAKELIKGGVIRGFGFWELSWEYCDKNATGHPQYIRSCSDKPSYLIQSLSQ